MPSARRPPSWQKYVVDCRRQTCPTEQRAQMERRLTGPRTRFLSRIVAAETAEDLVEKGRERRRAVVYAAKVNRLTKRVPPRTTPETRRGQRAREMTASVLAADAFRRQRFREAGAAAGGSELREYLRRFATCEPMTLRQHAARRLAAVVMKHEGEGWSTRPELPLTLPKTWFGRDERCRRREEEETEEEEEEEEEEERKQKKKVRAAVIQVAMGNCAEEHGRTWAGHWFASSGVDVDDDPSRLEHGQEGSFGWWGGVDDDTGLSSGARGSLASDFKLLVACHLRGRHLAKFVRSQPGGLLGIMQADVGQGKLGVPSDHFFHLLRVVMAQAEQYVGAVGHLQGTSCGCDCGSVGQHEKNRRLLRQELTAFEAAVSGESGVVHHALHWHGFTRVLNVSAPPDLLPVKYYRLVSLGGGVECRDPVTFRLPYPLHPLLVFPGASRGLRQTHFDMGEEEVYDEMRKLCDRSGYARSDFDRSFATLCGEEQLFLALQVLEACSAAGRHHVTVFVAFWMLTHLAGLLHPPAGSPHFYFRKFKVDVLVRLAASLSTFHVFLDLPLSCLALADGSSAVTGGVARCSNLLANRWQMAVARHEVLVAYGLHREASDLFVKNLGRVPSSSHLYDQLVLSHVWSQLCLSLDLLLETYVSLAMHKFCQAARECWKDWDLLEQTLARLERTVHGRLAEGSISQRLRVNLEGVLRLLPLLKHSRYRLDQNGRRPLPTPSACSRSPEENVRLAEKRARDRSLLDAHRAFWDGERNPVRLETLPPYYHLTWYVFQIALSKVVPVDGVCDDDEGREKYTKFVKGEISGRGGASRPRADTWMKRASVLAADRLFAVTVFFALWHGPTQSEPFWPSWPGHVPPVAEDAVNGLPLSVRERRRREAVAVLHRAAQKTHDLYRHCSSGRHHRLRLLERLLENLPVSRFVSSFQGEHYAQTAHRSVRDQAKNFAFVQSDAHLLPTAAEDLALLKYALRRDRVLVERVLDFGRHYTRWSAEF